jgi:hypothetical protein
MHVTTKCGIIRLLRQRQTLTSVTQKVYNQEEAEEIDEKRTTLLRENASASAFRIFSIWKCYLPPINSPENSLPGNTKGKNWFDLIESKGKTKILENLSSQKNATALTSGAGKTSADDELREVLDSNGGEGKIAAPPTRRPAEGTRTHDQPRRQKKNKGKNGDKGRRETGPCKPVKWEADPLREVDGSQNHQKATRVERGGSPPANSASHVQPRVARGASLFPSQRSAFF